jgi:GNAT superfamily N-acetyltransferase
VTAIEHDVMVRPVVAADRPSVLELLTASLGWSSDARHAEYFAWKHEQSPFGASPAWVAVDRDGELLGFRTFLRWELVRGSSVVRAVRAVDTATRPDVQRRGIFSRLTTAAVDALLRDDVAFVFNTPNQQSLPGYLRMGWEQVGRLPVSVRAASVTRLDRLRRARGPAEKWSLSSEAGIPAGDAFAEAEAVARLLGTLERAEGLHTNLSSAYLRWRYGLPALRYRVLSAGTGVEDGVAVFRLRQRGKAVEAVICDVLVPRGESKLAVQLPRQVVTITGADYGLRSGRSGSGGGFVPLPGQGPVLTWRALTETTMPSRRQWDLRLGDVELF